jgi:hypothetical protein
MKTYGPAAAKVNRIPTSLGGLRVNLWEAIEARNSVRIYTDRMIEGEVEEKLRAEIAACNLESGLAMQLCLNEPRAFSGFMARYGRFRNVRNYIALVGKAGADLDEKCGYYGEKIVLRATQLGLSTCWVGGTYKKSQTAAKVGPGEKLALVIAIGYGAVPGIPHKTKPIEALCRVEGEMPEWFLRGMQAVQLAPTAMNQQKFLFELSGNAVRAVALPGFFARVDLGIAKCHFEVGAGAGSWRWA